MTINGVAGQTLNYTGTAVLNSANVANNATNFVSGITALANNGSYLASNYLLPSETASSANNSVLISKANLTQVVASKQYDGLSTVTAAQIMSIG